MKVELVKYWGNDLDVVNSARVSLGKHKNEFDESDAKLIKYMVNNSHVSVLEHSGFTFRVYCPIFVARQIIRHKSHSFNECFDKETEILTKCGWKLFSELNEKDEVAQVTEDFSKYNFIKPIEIIKNSYKGEMIHFTSRDLDLMTTPNHDLYVSHYVNRKDERYTEFIKTKANDSSIKQHSRIPALPKLDLEKGSIEDYELGVLYGAFIGDGCISEDSKRIYFHVKKSSKKEFFNRLMNMETLQKYNWNKNEQDDGYCYYRVYNPDESVFKDRCSDKSLNLNYRHTELFYEGIFEGLMSTDGCVTENNNTSYSTVSSELAKNISDLCLILGRDATIYCYTPKNCNHSLIYKLTIRVSRLKLLKKRDIVNYDDYVYCVKVPTGKIIVRRNGKVAVTGNCSGRYIEFEPDFYVPEVFREQAPSVKQGSKSEEDSNLNQSYCKSIYEDVIETSYSCYKQLLNLGVCKEQARAVLPLCLYTEFYQTMNLRSFYHYMNLRLDPHAQQETRDLSRMMYDLVKEIPGNPFKYSLEAFNLI